MLIEALKPSYYVNYFDTLLVRMSLESEIEHKSLGDEYAEKIEPDILEDLRKEIEIPQVALMQLLSNSNNQSYADQFQLRVTHINSQAVKAIREGTVPRAMVFLNEAERILEHAASTGKLIGLNLVNAVLHNQACCFQLNWELEQCTKYAQALVYSLNQSGEENHENAYFSVLQPVKISLNNLQAISHYSLVLCATNSQLGNHVKALSYAKKAQTRMREAFGQLANMAVNLETGQKLKLQQESNRLKALGELATMKLQPHLQNRHQYREAVIYSIHRWKTKSLSINSHRQLLKKVIGEFTIGAAVQILPKEIDSQHQKENKQLFDEVNFIQMVIRYAVSFFTAATELRLIVSEQEGQGNSVDYLKSELCHIQSIILVTMFIPFHMTLIQNMITSFQSHYDLPIHNVSIVNLSIKSMDIDQLLFDCHQKIYSLDTIENDIQGPQRLNEEYYQECKKKSDEKETIRLKKSKRLSVQDNAIKSLRSNSPINAKPKDSQHRRAKSMLKSTSHLSTNKHSKQLKNHLHSYLLPRQNAMKSDPKSQKHIKTNHLGAHNPKKKVSSKPKYLKGTSNKLKSQKVKKQNLTEKCQASEVTNYKTRSVLRQKSR